MLTRIFNWETGFNFRFIIIFNNFDSSGKSLHVKRKDIPFSPPDITEDDIGEVVETLRSGWITTGPRCNALSEQLKAHTGAAGAYCLSSGTAALSMALKILGIGEGDEVILPAYTFTATGSVVADCGAVPVLVDSRVDGYNIDCESVAAAVTTRTKAIIGVDIGGVMADYSSLKVIAEDNRKLFNPNCETQRQLGRIAVIADAAHSLGACRDNISSGNAADFSAFSFHAVKNLTTAEGGALTWSIPADHDDMIRLCRLMSCHGIARDALARKGSADWEYDVEFLGSKCNMPDTLAALALSQLRRYDAILEKRRNLIHTYDEMFADTGISFLAHSGSDFSSSGHLYMVKLPEHTDRDRIFQIMHEAGISCNVHFKPLPLHTAWQRLGYTPEATPRVIRHFRHELTLPLYTRLSHEDAGRVAATLIEAVNRQ